MCSKKIKYLCFGWGGVGGRRHSQGKTLNPTRERWSTLKKSSEPRNCMLMGAHELKSEAKKNTDWSTERETHTLTHIHKTTQREGEREKEISNYLPSPQKCFPRASFLLFPILFFLVFFIFCTFLFSFSYYL